LGKVLVGSANDNLLGARVFQGQRCRSCEGVVGFKLHHWPHNNARCGEDIFKDRKLRKKVRFDPFTGLVTCPELVPKRLDHVVGGNADVRDAFAHHAQHRRKHAAHRPYFASLRIARLWHRKVVPKQLVRTVNQVDFQNASPQSP
jgi:hypothetical protein